MRSILKAAVILVAGIGIGQGLFAIYHARTPPEVNIEDRRRNIEVRAKGYWVEGPEDKNFCKSVDGCKLGEWPDYWPGRIR